MSDDDIAELKRMRDSGEISSAQYEVLRRHVLWGTPLPEAIESLADPPGDPLAGQAAGPRHAGLAPPQHQPPQPPEQQAPPQHLPAPQPPPQHLPGRHAPQQPHPQQPPPPQPQHPAPQQTAPQQTAKARRRSRRRGRAVFLLGLLLAAALGGAGVWWFVLRKPGVAPEEYARAVCSRVDGWHGDMADRSGQLQQALSSNEDPEAVRTALASFFDQVATRTGQLRSAIDTIGVPQVAGGRAYRDGLDQKLDETAASFRDSAQKARELNVRDRATFTITVQVLQSQVDQLISGVTGSLASTSTPGDLRTAYSNASGCAPFTG